MDHSDAWQMSIGNPTPEVVAKELLKSGQPPAEYVDEANERCADAAGPRGEPSEEEVRAMLAEHRDAMVRMVEEAQASLPSRAEQAVEGLGVTAASGVVLVDDGHARWLCPEDRWDAAYKAMEALPPLEGEEADVDAYGELCRRVSNGGAPVASLDGGSDHGPAEMRRALVRQALDADLIDADTARRMGLPA